MDLPIQEENEAIAARVMHACGHDGHTAIAGYSLLSSQHRDDFIGTVKIIFQPAEEGQEVRSR